MWGHVEELLAQLIEEVSVLTADRRRKKPREVRRPDAMRAASSPATPTGYETGAGTIHARGHAQMLAFAVNEGAFAVAPGKGTSTG